MSLAKGELRCWLRRFGQPPEQAHDEYHHQGKQGGRGGRKAERRELASITPPITVPAWACSMTGTTCGQLGIYGFRNRKDNTYNGLSIATSDAVKQPAVWDPRVAIRVIHPGRDRNQVLEVARKRRESRSKFDAGISSRALAAIYLADASVLPSSMNRISSDSGFPSIVFAGRS